jgi:hypothetical protein
MGMRGHPGIYLLAVAFVAASFGASAAPQTAPAQAFNPTCTLSAPEISREIEQNGVHELMSRLTRGHDGKLYDYTGFGQLVDCIWGGKKEWLDIAVPVIAETQPDNEDDLSDAVQNALLVNPEAVLSEPWPSSFTVRGYICTLSVDDYSAPNTDDRANYKNAMAELERRVQAVKRMKRPDLKSKVDECLASFEETRKYFTHLYQMDKPAADSGAKPNQLLLLADDDQVPPAPDPGTAPPAPDPGTAPNPPDPPPAPDPGTAPPAPDPGTAPPAPDPGTAPPPPDPGTAPPPPS